MLAVVRNKRDGSERDLINSVFLHTFKQGMIESFFILALIGLGIGTLGTMIGAGGGFILVPVLIILYPDLSPGTITAISIAIVAVNATIGSISYLHDGKVDIKTGLYFAAVSIPGSILGTLATKIIPRKQFDILFGIVLVAIALFLFLRGGQGKAHKSIWGNKHLTTRHITDRFGENYDYSFHMGIGLLVSVGVGFFAPLLGIGGGIIHVPQMTEWLNFPVHIATATSHFVLAIVMIVSVITHAISGQYDDPQILKMIGALLIGVIPGSLLGAAISRKITGKLIIKALSVALILVGLRIVLGAFHINIFP